MDRREFLRLGGCGLAAVVVGGAGGWALFHPGSVAHAANGTFDLTLVEAQHEMVDGIPVPAWAFESSLLQGPRIPGPAIFATEGEAVRIRVRNTIARGGAHGWAIPGVAATGPLAPGEEVEITFNAPGAGTYMYLDPFNEPVNRVMGLHGVLVVLPPAVGSNTPYSAPTANVQRLFDDFGTAAHFPGHPWNPDRNAIWVFSTIDPDKHALAAASAGGISPALFLGGYLPQYFTVNGKSGFFAAQHQGGHQEPVRSPDLQANISIHGHVGEPCLIRNVNAGLMWHSPHIHGNHVYLLARNETVMNNLSFLDTWFIAPAARMDLLLPYIQPPDIPQATWQRFVQGNNQELFPLVYPVHDHNEISNTAAGGNYPQGMVSHWQIDGTVETAPEVITVDRAEMRIKTGQLFLSGRSSGNPGDVLSVHAGPDAGGPTLGTMTVAADGTWRFTGRALKAMRSRQVTVHRHESGAERRAVPLKLL